MHLSQRRNELEAKVKIKNSELEEKMRIKEMKRRQLEELKKAIKAEEARTAYLTHSSIEYVEYIRSMHNELQESKGNIRVFCRVRPLVNKEVKTEGYDYIEYPNNSTIILNGPVKASNTGKSKDTQVRETYKFDKVFKPSDDQAEIFKEISQLIQSALDGYKVCIFAYGQTGSGKTYTMEGKDDNEVDRGVIYRSINKVFQTKEELEKIGWKFNIEASFVEIYNETIRDLLSDAKNNEISNKDKCINFKATKAEELSDILKLAYTRRAIASTNMNDRSSRSHCIFQLKINSKNEELKQVRVGAVNLIDLAGSEKPVHDKQDTKR